MVTKNMRYVALLMLMFAVALAGCANNAGTDEQTAANNDEQANNGPANDEQEKVNSDSQANNSNAGEEGETSEEDKYGGSAKIRVGQQPAVLGYPPRMVPPSSVLPLTQPAMETLGRYNPDGTMGPWLAKDWEADPEGETITMYLQEGVKFHDGTDFDAEAVKWVFDGVLEAERPISSVLNSVEVTDSHTVVFHLDTWSGGLLEELFWIYPMGSPTAYEDMDENEALSTPVGTGPFQFDSLENDEYIRYTKFDDYWQEGLPYLDSIEMSIIVNENTGLNAFLNHEVDAAVHMPAEIIEQYEDSTDFEIVPPETSVGATGTGFVPNSGDPDSPFADVRVRKAVSYAIDKEEIVEGVYKGYATATNQYGLPDDFIYNPDLEPFEYDPEKAKELLEEAGYPDGFETTITGQENVSLLMQAIQGYLAEVGIDLNVNVVDKARFDAMGMDDGWEGLIAYVTTNTSELASEIRPHFGPNPALYGDFTIAPENVHELMHEYEQETDDEVRQQIGYDLQHALIEEHHIMIPIVYAQTNYMRHEYVQDDGYNTTRTGFFTPEEMWIQE